MSQHPPEDLPDVPNHDPGPQSSAQARASSEHTAAGVPSADAGDVSVRNSEVESVMNRRHWRETLRHAAFPKQEFKAFSSVDAYLGAARTGLDGIPGLFAARVQVYSLKADHVS